ncbi:MAG: hypothetical protein HY815_00305, partial [Candidatus Riflebacteria bacterium]|nr:hypothetical protein [Candidatus Riflebacteria bacterium]
MNRRNLGWAFLELLMVVALVGVLGAAYWGQLRGEPMERAAMRICVANMRTLAAAVSAYHLDRGTTPGTGLERRMAAELVLAGYLRSDPACPS